MVTADDITDEVVEEEEEEKCPVTHSEAAHMFEQCNVSLGWNISLKLISTTQVQ